MSFFEGTNYQADREDKKLPMFDSVQQQNSALELNKWYPMKDFKSNINFICLVKFDTIDAGNEYRVMIFEDGKWYNNSSPHRVFADRVTEYMPIELLK